MVDQIPAALETALKIGSERILKTWDMEALKPLGIETFET